MPAGLTISPLKPKTMKYILVLDNVNGKLVELTKPINWNSVIEAQQLCRGFELSGKKLLIQLQPKTSRITRNR
jgi:hypothetical protein